MSIFLSLARLKVAVTFDFGLVTFVELFYFMLFKLYTYSRSFERDVGACLREKAKVSLIIESFEKISTGNIFIHISLSLHLYSIVSQIAELSYFGF